MLATGNSYASCTGFNTSYTCMLLENAVFIIF